MGSTGSTFKKRHLFRSPTLCLISSTRGKTQPSYLFFSKSKKILRGAIFICRFCLYSLHPGLVGSLNPKCNTTSHSLYFKQSNVLFLYFYKLLLCLSKDAFIEKGRGKVKVINKRFSERLGQIRWSLSSGYG